MSTHDERHEQALLEWLAHGPTQLPAEEWADHADRPNGDCGACRAFLAECAEQEAALEAVGEELRRDLGDARELARSGQELPGEARVESFLTERLAPPPRPLRPVWFVAAAALLLLGLATLLQRPASDGSTDLPQVAEASPDGEAEATPAGAEGAPAPSDDFLGIPDGVNLRPTYPLGPVPRYSDFAWDGTLPPEWTATVRVFESVGSERRASAKPLEVSRPLRSSPWVPGASRSSSWPDQIEWELELRDGAGRSRGVVSAAASRSSH